MPFVTTKDGVELFYKDWGPQDAQPIVFHHGWPLSSDDWDAQMLFFVQHGYRVVAHDRRGHGRSSQVLRRPRHGPLRCRCFAVVEALNLRTPSISAIPPAVAKSPAVRRQAWRTCWPRCQGRAGFRRAAADVRRPTPIPRGLAPEVFDGLRAALAANRAQFFLDLPTGPFYGFNRDGAKVSQGVITNWWRQGMNGSAKAHYEGIKAFSETDQTEDLEVDLGADCWCCMVMMTRSCPTRTRR